MADEFESLNSRIPDFATALAARAAARNVEGDPTLPPPGTVDPYKLMLNKKRAAEAGDIDPGTIVRWPEEAVKQLEDYCAKMGILGFNCGKMHPLAALAMLKKQVGDYSDTPLEERVPEGYEKRGTHSGYGPNYPYTEAMKKKQILHG